MREEGHLRALSVAGVNRISLGLQALNDKDLSLLNRDHKSVDGLRALDLASEVFPGHVSVDLMFARPGQSVADWDSELDRLFASAPDLRHVSLYQLTLERGTRLFRDVESGLVQVPSEDDQAEMYELAVDKMRALGLGRGSSWQNVLFMP